MVSCIFGHAFSDKSIHLPLQHQLTHPQVLRVPLSPLQMSNIGDWDFIDDSDVPPAFISPKPKASTRLARPSCIMTPRMAAPHQVSDLPAWSSSSRGSAASGPDSQSFRGCAVRVSDAVPVQTSGHSVFSQVGVRSAPYHVGQSSVGLPRPERRDFHPSSLQSTPMQLPLESIDVTSEFHAVATESSTGLGRFVVPRALAVPTQLKTSSGAQQLQRLKRPSESTLLTSQFQNLLEQFGTASDVFSALTDSTFAAEHRSRLLDGYAASTVFRYMQAIQQFSKTLSKLGWDFTTLTQSQLVDTLSVMSQSRSCSSDGMSGNFTIKALRWFRKIAGVRCLDLAFSPLVDSFLKLRLTKDKREAPPLPLWILFQWERRILQSQCTIFETIMLGSFLFIVWSGLRFADAQRLNLQSLVLNDEELRGMVWRSKTQSSGHPFGVVSSGLCSTGTFSWLVKFLRTWDKLLMDHAELKSCDFLIPHLAEEGAVLSGDPMDYATTQKILRHMLRTPWKTFKEAHPLASLTMNYTVHSLKVTLLSFGPQLGNAVADDDRLQ